jgi:hypothetical protein
VDNPLKDEIGNVNDWEIKNAAGVNPNFSVHSLTVIQLLFTVQKIRI